jgi:flagellar hook-length control protein FliK
MQAFLPSSLLANTPVLPAANPPTPSARAAVPNGNNAFSRQLEQSRQRAQDSARAAPQPAANKAAAPPPAAPKPQNKPPEPTRSEAQRAAAPRGPRKADTPAHAESNTPEAGADAKSTGRADGSDADATAPAALGDLLGLLPPPADPAVVPTDAALAQPSATGANLPDGLPPGQPRPATAPAMALNDNTGDATAATPTASAGRSTGATPATALALPAQAAEREAAGTASATPASWQQAQAAAALAEGMGATREGKAGRLAEAHAISDGADRSLAPVGLAGPGSSALHTARAGEAAQASLAAPVTSPEFRAALGAQVSILARAGVQQAELHLNPAELGPVSVQIVLDGQQAQVNFGADSALTRQIIEAGMPELAGALRDAGLTLTGGGVSQHAGGQRQDGSGNGTAGGSGSSAQSGTGSDGTSDALAEQARRSSARVAQGGVDLYA